MEDIQYWEKAGLDPSPAVADFTGTVDGGGYKARMDDPSKLQPTQLPPQFIEGVTRVLMFGARKYSRGNWMRGMSFSDVLDAAQTHMLAVLRGEDIDRDSGLRHIYHAACNLAFLAWYQDGPQAANYTAFDDRLFKENPDGQGQRTQGGGKRPSLQGSGLAAGVSAFPGCTSGALR